jgi:prepilin signal peptidase PulO-like enzyme (type II secretory pathway)
MFSFVGLSLKKIKRTSYIPFGPFIAAGTVVYIFFGEQIIHWYLTFSGLK